VDNNVISTIIPYSNFHI